MLAVCLVVPGLRDFRRGHRGRVRAQFGAPGKGIGLERQTRAVAVEDLVLVDKARIDAGNEDFPNAGVGAQPHDVATAVPVVELADDRNTLRIGCPDGEMVAAGTVMLDRVRPHLVEEPEMRAFANVIIVHRSENRTEAVGIDDHPFAALIAGAVADGLWLLQRHRAFEEAGIVAPFDRPQVLARERFDCHRLGIGDEAAGKDGLADGVHAKNRKGVVMRALEDGRDIRG